jgi:hypothetical protein
MQETAPELYGCDVNVDALRPPLPYPDDLFGLVHAISVFTHLPEHLQREWIDELRRVRRADGLAVITTCGESTTTLLTAYGDAEICSR